MIDIFKRTFVIGLLVVLCFLQGATIIKQLWLDEELTTLRFKIISLEWALQDCIKDDEE